MDETKRMKDYRSISLCVELVGNDKEEVMIQVSSPAGVNLLLHPEKARRLARVLVEKAEKADLLEQFEDEDEE